MPLLPALLLAFALPVFALPALAAYYEDDADADATEEQKQDDSTILSYSVGFDLGGGVIGTLANIEASVDDFDIEALIAGMQAALEQEEPDYLEVDMQKAVNQWLERQKVLVTQKQEIANKEAEAAWAVAATKNLEQARAFLDANKPKKGIVETESGLQYQLLRESEEGKPDIEDWVKVHYKGETLDGNEFDSSYVRGEPTIFPLKGVIAGWSEGLQLLGKGGQARLFVPPHLAYGEGGPTGGPLPFGPNSLLIFEVELLDFAVSEEALR